MPSPKRRRPCCEVCRAPLAADRQAGRRGGLTCFCPACDAVLARLSRLHAGEAGAKHDPLPGLRAKRIERHARRVALAMGW